MSGTSMAAPHGAGIAATLLSQGITFSNLKNTILNTASRNLISGFSSNTPNIFVNTGFSNNFY
jgi:cerevisin